MKALLYILIILGLNSCASAKYSLFFETGKELDFSEGKWLLNKSQSNSKIFDTELYYTSKNYFKEILGDSLLEIDDLRSNKLITPKISFSLSSSELRQLKKDADCDYIINIKGNIIGDGAGSVSFQNDSNVYYNASNRSSVFISIYDLNTGILISSSQAYGKSTSESSHFDGDNGSPDFPASSHTMMLKAAKKLIRKYKKNEL